MYIHTIYIYIYMYIPSLSLYLSLYIYIYIYIAQARTHARARARVRAHARVRIHVCSRTRIRLGARNMKYNTAYGKRVAPRKKSATSASLLVYNKHSIVDVCNKQHALNYFVG